MFCTVASLRIIYWCKDKKIYWIIFTMMQENQMKTEKVGKYSDFICYNLVISFSDSPAALAISAMGGPICFILRATV